jgi:putative hydrolase of the HAD superfamily
VIPDVAVVMFDLDDTLFAHRDAVTRGIRARMNELGGVYRSAKAGSAVELWHELEERHYHSYLAGELDFEGQRRARARDFATHFGITLDADAAGAWFDRYFEHYVDGWSLHDDALPTFRELRAHRPGVRLGLITNGDIAFQRRKVERVGLDSEIEHVIASSEVGVAKPDRRIFEYACTVFGVLPSQAVYVGDRLRTDAIGAAEAGLTGIWINRGSVVPTTSETADARAAGVLTIRALSELPALLTNESAGGE